MDKTLAEVFEKKAEFFQSESLQCTNTQVNPDKYDQVFNQLPQVPDETHLTSITHEDTTTGFMIYSAYVFCAESSSLYQFLATLISNQSPRTIIQGIVSTIQSEEGMKGDNKKKVNQIYLELGKMLDLQYGKILLATATPRQLKDMIAKEWPFFGNYTEEVKDCLHGNSCQVVQDLVQTLGDLTEFYKPIYLYCRIRWPGKRCKHPSSSYQRLPRCTNS